MKIKGKTLKKSKLPPGWNEKRVLDVLTHYEKQTEEEAIAEDEAADENALPIDELRPEYDLGQLLEAGVRGKYVERSRRKHMVQIEVPLEKLGAFCQRRHISRLALFGSVLRKDFRPESDVDVLVEFEPGRTPGFEFVSVQEELSALLGNRKVDLVSPKFLNRRIRDQVLREAELVYEKK